MTDSERPALTEQRSVESVYQPAEDSRLLAETAIPYVDRADQILDAGTGSGYVAARIADETDADVLGSDVNPSACREAARTGVPVVRANLLDPFRDGAFDVAVFNPPYLPTEPGREWDDWMAVALSGGEDGREVIEPFLDDLVRVLAPDGHAFVLVSTLTGVEAVRDYARSNGLTTREAATEPHPYEKLIVLHLRPAGATR